MALEFYNLVYMYPKKYLQVFNLSVASRITVTHKLHGSSMKLISRIAL